MDRAIYYSPVVGLHYDPLRVWRKLIVGSKSEINSWLADHRGEDVLAAAVADEKIIPVVLAAFDLKPIDPKTGLGWTDAEALLALDSFLEYLEGKDKRGSDSPAKSPCADCPPR